jgi:hypothetical protein
MQCCNGEAGKPGAIESLAVDVSPVPTEEASGPAPAAVVEAKISELDAPTKAQAVVLRFKLPDDSKKEVIFTQRPLGFDFHMKMPIKVIRDPAVQSGVERGWILDAIDGKDLEGMDFDTVHALLKKGVSELDEAQAQDGAKIESKPEEAQAQDGAKVESKPEEAQAQDGAKIESKLEEAQAQDGAKIVS